MWVRIVEFRKDAPNLMDLARYLEEELHCSVMVIPTALPYPHILWKITPKPGRIIDPLVVDEETSRNPGYEATHIKRSTNLPL